MHQHGLSRRAFLKAGAATGAVIATNGMLSTSVAASSGTPTPVPADAAFGGLHVYGVDPSMEPSAITNFHGAVGGAVVRGPVMWMVMCKPAEEILVDSDMRFLRVVL